MRRQVAAPKRKGKRSVGSFIKAKGMGQVCVEWACLLFFSEKVKGNSKEVPLDPVRGDTVKLCFCHSGTECNGVREPFGRHYELCEYRISIVV